MNRDKVLDGPTRDYYFDLLGTLDMVSIRYIVNGMYGHLEGYAWADPEPLLTMMEKIQRHADFDHGIE